MTLYKVVPMQVGQDARWGVECISDDGTTDVIGPFETEAQAHREAERMATLEGERGS
jgi:hypothetical protein